MNKFESKEDLVEWVETMHLQNTNGRESNNEMFRLGIKAAIEELIELNLFSLTGVVQAKREVCDKENKNTNIHESPTEWRDVYFDE